LKKLFIFSFKSLSLFKMSNPYNLPLQTAGRFDPANRVTINFGPFNKIESQTIIRTSFARKNITPLMSGEFDLPFTRFDWDDDLSCYIIECGERNQVEWCQAQAQIVWNNKFNNVCCTFTRLNGSQITFHKVSSLTRLYNSTVQSNIVNALSAIEFERHVPYIPYGSHSKPYNLPEDIREYLTRDYV